MLIPRCGMWMGRGRPRSYWAHESAVGRLLSQPWRQSIDFAGGRRKNVGRAYLEMWLVDFFSVAGTPNDVVRYEIARNIGIGY